MKAIIALFAAVTLFFEACFIPPLYINEDINNGNQVNEISSSEPEKIPFEDYVIPEGVARESFDSLDENGQKLYSIIHEIAESMNSESVRIADKMTLDEMEVVFDAYINDYPECFWLYRNFSRVNMGAKTYIELSYCVDSVEQRDKMRDELNDIANDIVKEAFSISDEYERELFLHDTIVKMCKYDYAAVEGGYESNELSYAAYGAIVSNLAVCEGYSRAMQLLSRMCGIECTLISGTAGDDRESHMWNIITINSSKYHLDLTWNDIEETEQNNGKSETEETESTDPESDLVDEEPYNEEISHAYFNLTDELISFDHYDFEPQNCNSINDNYYNRNARLFAEWSSEYSDALTTYAAECMDNKYSVMTVAFLNEESYNKALEHLIDEDNIFYMLDKANKISSNDVVSDTIRYTMIEGPLYIVSFGFDYK